LTATLGRACSARPHRDVSKPETTLSGAPVIHEMLKNFVNVTPEVE
jgi:hypothetical protein